MGGLRRYVVALVTAGLLVGCTSGVDRGAPSTTAATSIPTKAPPRPSWSYDTGGGRQIAVADGRVYVAGNRRLTAYDMATGKQIWRVPIADNEAWGARVWASKDRLLVGVSLRANGGKGRRSAAVLLVDAGSGTTTGLVSGDWQLGYGWGDPLASDTTVLMGVTDLRGVDSTGTMQWKRTDNDPARMLGCGPDLLVFENTVDGRITAISPVDGTDRWQGGPETTFTTPIWCDNDIVVVQRGRRDGVLVLDRATGAVRSQTGATRRDEGFNQVIDGVLLAQEPTRPPSNSDTDAGTTLRAYDLTEANTMLWERRDRSCPWQGRFGPVNLGGDRVLAPQGLGCGGRAQVFDLGTGKLTATGPGPLDEDDAQPVPAGAVLLQRGEPFATGMDEPERTAGLYRRSDLTELWSVHKRANRPLMLTDGTTVVSLDEGILTAYSI
jgi:hypothetical protein